MKIRNWLAGAGAVLGTAALSLAQTATPYAVPTELQPNTVADSVFAIVAPFVPVMVTIGVTLMVTLVVYKVIVRKVHSFGQAA